MSSSTASSSRISNSPTPEAKNHLKPSHFPFFYKILIKLETKKTNKKTLKSLYTAIRPSIQPINHQPTVTVWFSRTVGNLFPWINISIHHTESNARLFLLCVALSFVVWCLCSQKLPKIQRIFRPPPLLYINFGRPGHFILLLFTPCWTGFLKLLSNNLRKMGLVVALWSSVQLASSDDDDTTMTTEHNQIKKFGDRMIVDRMSEDNNCY